MAIYVSDDDYLQHPKEPALRPCHDPLKAGKPYYLIILMKGNPRLLTLVPDVLNFWHCTETTLYRETSVSLPSACSQRLCLVVACRSYLCQAGGSVSHMTEYTTMMLMEKETASESQMIGVCLAALVQKNG